MPKYAKDITGKRFGRYRVIKKDPDDHTRHICECDCGTIRSVNSASLRGLNSKSCGCLRSDNGRAKRKGPGVSACNTVYSQYRATAISTGKAFQISKSEFKDITSLPCFYCGSPPSNVKKNANHDSPYVYSGIDRVDSSVGYVLENCVPCCAYCNFMKRDHHQETFIAWLAKCHDHLSKTTQLLSPSKQNVANTTFSNRIIRFRAS